jgi:DNA-binding CsgD family transcriptional regulator/PAS domain-containing protein
MNAVSKISGLLEDIYDAALEPARWNDVVAGINTFVSSRACGIVSKDPISKFGITHYYCGADPHFIKLYAEGYSKFDPLVRLPAPGRVVSIPDLVAYDEYRRGPFYQEWLRPQGSVDCPAVVLDGPDSTSATVLTFLVGKQMMDADMRRRIALVAPHVKRALMINRAIEYRNCQASTFADTLDGLSAGIFLVDAQCRIVHANVAGQAMLHEDNFLRSIGGQLVAFDRQVNRELHEGVAGDIRIAAGRVAFSLTTHDGEHYVVHLLPLKSAMRASVEASSMAIAAVFVRKVELDAQSYGGIVARTFGLTPAELRVLLTIVEVGGVPETSERLGVAETTVKTHLYRVFSKTGANRQADLVKLAAGFSNPLAS